MPRVKREKRIRNQPPLLHDPPYVDRPVKLRTVLSDEVCQNICRYVFMGAPYDIAAEACGIPSSTESEWRQRGMSYITEIEETGAPEIPCHEIFAQYARAVITARAKWQVRVLKRSFQDAFRSTWIRDLALLERRDPNNWRLRDEDIMKEEELYDPDESFL